MNKCKEKKELCDTNKAKRGSIYTDFKRYILFTFQTINKT